MRKKDLASSQPDLTEPEATQSDTFPLLQEHIAVTADRDRGPAQASFETGHSTQEGTGSAGLTRRQMLKITAGAVAAAPLVGQALSAAAKPLNDPVVGAAGQKSPLFFTPEEFAIVDELTEIIIPTDAHSPGARAAEVAAFIDARVNEAFEPETKETWRNGLKLVDQLSQSSNGVPFMKATPQQRMTVVGQMAKGESNPQQPEERFFVELKHWTATGYYTSKIGIHKEMEYKGNTYQNEFSGYDAT
jgi:hypothetical protein